MSGILINHVWNQRHNPAIQQKKLDPVAESTAQIPTSQAAMLSIRVCRVFRVAQIRASRRPAIRGPAQSRLAITAASAAGHPPPLHLHWYECLPAVAALSAACRCCSRAALRLQSSPRRAAQISARAGIRPDRISVGQRREMAGARRPVTAGDGRRYDVGYCPPS